VSATTTPDLPALVLVHRILGREAADRPGDVVRMELQHGPLDDTLAGHPATAGPGRAAPAR